MHGCRRRFRKNQRPHYRPGKRTPRIRVGKDCRHSPRHHKRPRRPIRHQRARIRHHTRGVLMHRLRGIAPQAHRTQRRNHRKRENDTGELHTRRHRGHRLPAAARRRPAPRHRRIPPCPRRFRRKRRKHAHHNGRRELDQRDEQPVQRPRRLIRREQRLHQRHRSVSPAACLFRPAGRAKHRQPRHGGSHRILHRRIPRTVCRPHELRARHNLPRTRSLRRHR